MPVIQVHNISDRPNTSVPAKALVVGGRKLRPGRSVTVDIKVLNSKHLEQLHGTYLWFGELPSVYTRTSKAGQKARSAAPGVEESSRPMTQPEARAYLEQLSQAELLGLLEHMSPRVTFKRDPSKAALVARLSRAVFKPSFELDPDAFSWLRRWTRNRHGDYALRE